MCANCSPTCAFRGGFAELEGAVDLQHRDHGSQRGGTRRASSAMSRGPAVDAHGGGRHLGGGSHEPDLGAVDDQVVPCDAESGYEQTPGEKLWWGSATQVTCL